MALLSRTSMKRNGGFALPLVIWTLALIAAIALGMTAESRADLAVARNLTDAAKAEAAADGGLWRTVAKLVGPARDDQWRADGTPLPTTVGAMTVDVAVQDEGGKVDLNRADPELIAGLMQSVGIGSATAHALVEQLVAARAPRDAGPKGHALTESDVATLIGDGGLWQRLRPFVTVYSGQPGINPTTAPAEVLLALPSVQEADVSGYLSIRGHSPRGIGVLQNFPSLMAASRFMSWSDADTYTITATAKGPRATFNRVAVIDLSGSSDQPYDVLAWRNTP